jgi:hypothetical protein
LTAMSYRASTQALFVWHVDINSFFKGEYGNRSRIRKRKWNCKADGQRRHVDRLPQIRLLDRGRADCDRENWSLQLNGVPPREAVS